MTELIEQYIQASREYHEKASPVKHDAQKIMVLCEAMSVKQNKVLAQMTREERQYVHDNYLPDGRGKHAFRQKWLSDNAAT